MKVRLGGFGRCADMISIKTPEGFRWRDIRGILAIPGVKYYYVYADCIGVRCSDEVDKRDVAAQSLQVLAEAIDITPADFDITVENRFLVKTAEAEIVTEVQRRAQVVIAREHIRIDQVEARGKGPAYWLSSSV